MAAIATQNITDAGMAPTTQAAQAGGDTWAPDDRTFLLLNNTSGSAVVCTIPSYFTDVPGATHTDKTVSVPANASRYVRVPAVPFGDPANGGVAKVTAATPASITVAALRLA